MTAQRIAIFGATSDIATAYARLLAKSGAKFVLVARDGEGVKGLDADLRVRGSGEVVPVIADLRDTRAIVSCVAQAWGAFDGFDVALIAYGSLPDQVAAQGDAMRSSTRYR